MSNEPPQERPLAEDAEPNFEAYRSRIVNAHPTKDRFSFYQRFEGPVEGYCRLCGQIMPLKFDHIPPKSWYDTRSIELREYLGGTKKVPAPKGLMFRTICQNCNSERLGRLDGKVGKLIQSVSRDVEWMRRERLTKRNIEYSFSERSILRCIVGHFVAGFDPPRNCEFPLSDQVDPYKIALRQYWKEEISRLPESVSVHYWLHLHEDVVFAPQFIFVARRDEPDSIITCSMLKFPPIALMICDYGKSRYRFTLPAVNSDQIEERNIRLKLEIPGLPREYPFNPIGGSALLFTKDMVYYGIKNN